MAQPERRVDVSGEPGPATPTRVVYIMGAGRSGSTLLGILLGNAPDMFYAGELDAWIRRGGVANGDDPALGEFWAPVAERMRRWLDRPAPDFFTEFEHPRGLLRRIRGDRRTPRATYLRYNRELYAAIRDRSGAGYVIDSSHFPLRRWNLRGAEGVDVRTVLLVRDPAEVVAAFEKPVQKPKGFWSAVAYLWVVHLLSAAVYLTLPRDRRLVVRYEDVVAAPGLELQRIGRWLGADVSGVDPSALVPGPVFQGNRMRTRARVSVERRAAHEPPPRPAAVAMAPWTAIFGYRGNA